MAAEIKWDEQLFAKQLIGAACADDREVLARPGVVAGFLVAARERFSHGSLGLSKDATMLYRSSFDLV